MGCLQNKLTSRQTLSSRGFENINDMLVPVLWLEESAMIPEEAALKFRSMYTERVRKINLALLSLFAAAILLLLLDWRLFASLTSSADAVVSAEVTYKQADNSPASAFSDGQPPSIQTTASGSGTIVRVSASRRWQ